MAKKWTPPASDTPVVEANKWTPPSTDEEVKKKDLPQDSDSGSEPLPSGGQIGLSSLDPTEHDTYTPSFLTQSGRDAYKAHPEQFQGKSQPSPATPKSEDKESDGIFKDAGDYAFNTLSQFTGSVNKTVSKTLSGLAGFIRNTPILGEVPKLTNTDGSPTEYANHISAIKDPLGALILGLNGITKGADELQNTHKLPDNFAGNVVTSAVNIVPDLAATALIPEAKIGELATGAAEVTPSAITTLGKYIWNPFTKWSAAKGFTQGYADAQSEGKDNGESIIVGALKGGIEGAYSGATMGVLGGVAGKVSESALNGLVNSGIVKPGGQLLTNYGLKILSNSTIFGGQSFANKLAEGGSWDDAVKEGETQAGIGAVFGIKEGADEHSEVKERSKQAGEIADLNTQQINSIINGRQVNALRNFMMATPAAITEAHANPTEIGDLNAKALEYAQKAEKERNPDKKSQLTLLAQTFAKTSDVKGLADIILDNPDNKDALVKSIQESELAEPAKQAMINKINSTVSALHPDEIAKRTIAETKKQLGSAIDTHNKNIADLNTEIANTQDETEKQQKFLQVNENTEQLVKAQTDLFNLVHHNDNLQAGIESGSLDKNGEPVDNTPKELEPVSIPDNEHLQGAQIVSFDPEKGIDIKEADGKIHNLPVEDAREVGIDQSLIDKFRSGKPVETTVDTPAPAPAQVTFKTAKGSIYKVNEDGTTTRDKAARNDAGHEGQSGLQETSHATYYLSPEQADILGEIQANHPEGREIGETSDGRIGIKYTTGKDAGKFEGRSVLRPSSEPEIGMVPLEVIQGKTPHFGNKITDIIRPDKPGTSSPKEEEEKPAAEAKTETPEPAQNEFDQKLQDTTNPKEVAAMYDDHLSDLKNNLGMDGAIADYNGKMSMADFERYGDKNHITTAIARNYIERKGSEQKYIPLDIQADEINERYFNGQEVVGPEDIVDFAIRHPGGHDTYFTPKGNERLEAINNRHVELTGKRLNKATARKYAEEYRVSKIEAEKVAETMDTPENDERIQLEIAKMKNSEQLSGKVNPDHWQEAFDAYMADPEDFWNMWHPVYDGRLPDEEEVNYFNSVLNEIREGNKGQSGPTDQGDADQDRSIESESQTQEGDTETTSGGYSASSTEPERVRAEYDTRIADIDDQIEKAGRELSRAQQNINQNNDIFASSGVDDGKKTTGLFNEPANVSAENVDRILKPIADRLSKLKSDREALLNEQDKAVEQASRQTSLEQALASNGRDSKLNPEETDFAHRAMRAVFPNIQTKFYNTEAEFTEALDKTGLHNTISKGSTIHAFVDKDRVIHFNPAEVTPETPIHEQGHILTSWARQHAPLLYKEMLRAGGEMTEVHKQLKNNGYTIEGHQLHEEAFVTALGKDGVGKLKDVTKKDSQKSAIRKLINESWLKFERWITEKTGYSLSKGKNIKDMSFGELVDLVNDKYLMSGTKISDLSSEELAKRNKSENASANEKPKRLPGEELRDYVARIKEYRDKQIDSKVPTLFEDKAGAADQTTIFGDNWEVAPETPAEKIQRVGQDAMNRVKKTEKAITDAGGVIDEESGYYNRQRRTVAITEHELDKVHEDLFKSPDGKKNSLFERMKKEGISDSDFGMYLYAKHAGERNSANAADRQDTFNKEKERLEKRIEDSKNRASRKDEIYYTAKLKTLEDGKNVKYKLLPDGGSGMKNEEAKVILDRFDKDGLTDKMESLAKEYYDKVTKKQLQNDYDTGRITKEDYDRLKDRYKYYVPLQVEEHVNSKKNGTGTSKIIRVADAFKRAKGADNRQADQRVNPAKFGAVQLEKSIVEGEKNRVVNTLRKQVEQNPNPDVWEVIKPRYKPIYNADGTIDKLDEITDPKILRESMKGFEDGKPFYIHIKDDGLRRAILKEWKTKNDGIFKVINAIGSVNGIFRNTATIYNPAFWAKNIVKDNFSAMYNLNAQGIDGLATKFEKNIPASMKGVYQYQKGVRDTPEAKMFERYLESGARISYSRFELDTDKLATMKDYFDNLQENKYNPVVFTRKLGEYMGHISELLELTTRLSAFSAAVESGVPDHEAAIISKEATIDFAQKGEWSSAMNSLYLFSNAGVQGSTTFFRNMIKNPKSAAKIISGMVSVGILAAAYNHHTNGDAENDSTGNSDWKDYFRVNDYDKQGNILLRDPIGGGFIKVPTGHELGLYAYLGDKLYNVAIGKENISTASLDVGIYSLQAYTPIQGTTLTQALAPTIGKPIVQLDENKNAFGSPIFKDGGYNSSIPKSQEYFKNTNKIYVDIANVLHKPFGGTGVSNGLIEIHPETIKFALETVTGGSGKTVSQSVDLLTNSIMLKPTEVKNIPILSSFYTQGNDKNYKANISYILHDSRTNSISDIDRTKFYHDSMRAALRGDITDEKYDSMIKEFQKNQEKINLGKLYPDATDAEIKEMMK